MNKRIMHYVVTQGEYSDYHIRRVFSKKEDAERFISIYSRNTYGDELSLEEYEEEAIVEPYLFRAIIDVDGVLRTVEELGVPKENQSECCINWPRAQGWNSFFFRDYALDACGDLVHVSELWKNLPHQTHHCPRPRSNTRHKAQTRSWSKTFYTIFPSLLWLRTFSSARERP